jgi:predicted porin
MKKSLLAIAAMTACAGVAQAQSSVTIYGIMDVGYINQSVKNAGNVNQNGSIQGTTAYNATNTTGAQFGSSAEQTSRLGFKGTEDLGGGSSAFFTVEVGLTPTNGTNISGTTTGFNNRQSFAGLKKNGIGAVSIGTQYTPIHEAVAITDPGMQNNMPGNLMYASDAAGNSTAAATTPALTASNTSQYTTVLGGPASGTAAYIVRAGNSIKFVSDTFAGFTGKLFYSSASSTTNQTSVQNAGQTLQTGGVTTSSGWGLGADYAWQKLLVSADYQSFSQKTTGISFTNASGVVSAPGTAAGTNSPAGTSVAQVPSGTTWGTALQTIDNTGYIGATYDFGILKAYAQYITRKANASFDSNQYIKRTAQQIGVRSFVTPTIETWASGGMGKLTNAYMVQNGTPAYQTVGQNITAWQLGSNYWLSKRTNLYAIVGVQRTSNGVFPQVVSGNSAGINAVSNATSAYAIGMRHTF